MNAPVATAVPAGVVTDTLTTPAEPGGVRQVMLAAVATTLVAAAPPKVTLVAPLRLVPEMVTLVPPAVEPVAGVTALMAGAGTWV